MNRAKRIAISVTTIYTLLLVGLYLSQRSFLYFPSPEHTTPEQLGMSEFSEITTTTSDSKRLLSWYAAAQHDLPTILFFHGNAGNVAHRSTIYRHLTAAGYGVFAVGYPGYGGSGGQPSELKLVEAGQLAYEFLLQQGVKPRKIVIFGESLGSAVAVQIASRNDAKALFLQAPMSSVADVAKATYPIFPMELLLKDPFHSIKHIGQIEMPLLIVHGQKDKVIPLHFGKKLFDAANEPKRFVELPEAGHNDLYNFDTLGMLKAFIRETSDKTSGNTHARSGAN